MQITSVNLKQRNNKLGMTSEPAFQAKLVATPAAKKALKEEIERMPIARESVKEINFARIFSRFRSAFEKATGGIDGTTAKLSVKYGGNRPVISFRTANGKTLLNSDFNISALDILPNVLDDGKPLSRGVTTTIEKALEKMRLNGCGHGAENPFSTSLSKII